jgi:aldehyde dehydrogenase (NAD+)
MLNHKALFIDGRWQVPSGQGTAQVINPATEEVAGSVPLGDERDVDNAVAAARKAFGPWSRTPSSVRAGYIRALAEQLKTRADEMASVITTELGMPVQWCRSVQVDGPIIGLEQYVELAGLMDEVREVGNSRVYREAVGVCAFINPWNYPLHQLIGKLAPALAAGCTVVVKPSQETPLHAFLLAQMIEDIGLPAGVFNLVSGPGSKVGEALAKHPDVDMVSFTGSTGAGVRVSQAAAPSVKRVCLELGGKSALLIAEDADLEAAVRYGVQDVMINSGQTCTALTRMLLPASRYAQALEIVAEEQFVAAFAAQHHFHVLGRGARQVPERNGGIRRRRLVERPLDRGKHVGGGLGLDRQNDVLAAEMVGDPPRRGGFVDLRSGKSGGEHGDSASGGTGHCRGDRA